MASYANFGVIPYGHTVVGRVHFDETNKYGCKAFTNVFNGEGDPDNQPSPIIIVERGGCSFVKKIRNIEHAGGKLGVVVDETDKESVDEVIMVDDGTGNGISIPSLMINKKPGNEIIQYFLKADEDKKAQIAILVKFGIARPDDRVEYDLWMSSSDDRSLDFVQEFHPYATKLGKHAQMTPHYFTWSCENCDETIIKNDCVASGMFCAIDENRLNFKGKEIVMENLRQKCIYLNAKKNKNNAEDWWNYVTKAHSTCYTDFTEDCSKTVHNKLGLDYAATQKCVTDSFSDKKDFTKGHNELLLRDLQLWKKRGP